MINNKEKYITGFTEWLNDMSTMGCIKYDTEVNRYKVLFYKNEEKKEIIKESVVEMFGPISTMLVINEYDYKKHQYTNAKDMFNTAILMNRLFNRYYEKYKEKILEEIQRKQFIKWIDNLNYINIFHLEENKYRVYITLEKVLVCDVSIDENITILLTKDLLIEDRYNNTNDKQYVMELFSNLLYMYNEGIDASYLESKLIEEQVRRNLKFRLVLFFRTNNDDYDPENDTLIMGYKEYIKNQKINL